MNNLSRKIKQGCLLTAGTIDNYNTMTIGWATIGTLWGKEVVFCFVRPSRYTYQFMESDKFFSLSFYDILYAEALSYLGTHSGRDSNKVEEVAFTPIKIAETITFKEAYETIVCKKLYHQDLDDKEIPEAVKKTYYANGDFHRLYIGEVILKQKN